MCDIFPEKTIMVIVLCASLYGQKIAPSLPGFKKRFLTCLQQTDGPDQISTQRRHFTLVTARTAWDIFWDSSCPQWKRREKAPDVW